MVLGSYPCCDAPLMIPVPEKTPAYFSEECDECGAIVWHRLSRVDPMSWLEADFLADHIVDAETMTIKERDRPQSMEGRQ